MSIWNPHVIKFIESIESVQQNLFQKLRILHILKALNLPTLSYRRVMIEVYKIISNIYDMSHMCAKLKT